MTMDYLNLNSNAEKLPFWDNRIQSFLSAMPESWGRGLELKPTKYPLKWTLQNWQHKLKSKAYPD